MNKYKAFFRNQFQGDRIIWGVVFCFAIISIWVVYSATGTMALKRGTEVESFLSKHSLMMFLGFGAMWATHRFDYRFFSLLAKVILVLSVFLLLYTYLNGVKINAASRWLYVPFTKVTFQSSDLAKFALIASLASFLAKGQQKVRESFQAILPCVLAIFLICGLIALTDFSTAVLLFCSSTIMLFIGRVRVKHIALFLMIGAFLGTGAMLAKVGQRWKTVLTRVESYMDDGKMSFQAEQGHIAIYSGGTFGLGPGKSIQKNFLPHPYSDYVFATIIEEYGLVGGALVVLLYLVLLYRAMIISQKSDRPFGGLLAAGLCCSIVLQAFTNMAVVTGLIPVTGLPLPFISWGGTSLFFTGASLGVILSVSRKNAPDERVMPKRNIWRRKVQ
ncbi:MAG: FtsW/RodA/SpoVE family cell cycle protein [Cytophagales bacterium]|nr:FtsW/RodA/SpoVE family cell cycle protein [Cytophagales bacterium]